MIRTLPKEMAALMVWLRQDILEIAAMVRNPRPLSARTLAERIDDLVGSVDIVEQGLIRALEQDPNYDPSNWSPDDQVIINQE